MARKLLVTGATGKQGGATIKALSTSPPPFDYEILALTRNTSSAAAKKLATNPKVTLIEGDLSDCEAIFRKTGGVNSVWGVFLVTLPSFKKTDVNAEEVHGKNMIEASLSNNVKHLVYSSVDRGGSDQSDVNATNVPHFITKYNVEHHLRARTKGTAMTYTILRPVAFMENLTPDFPGTMFAAMWASMGDCTLQLVATKDIGIFAAKALAFAETDDYKNMAISLVGDDLTQAGGNEAFWKAKGRPMPRAYGFAASLLQWLIPELGTMFRWFCEVGYGGDVAQCRRLNKDMLTLEAWLREESKFKR